jgi:hypothetical protein
LLHIVPDGTVVVDLVRERKPRFVPAQVIAEYAELLRSYRVTEVYGDNHAGGFTAARLGREGRPGLATTHPRLTRVVTD